MKRMNCDSFSWSRWRACNIFEVFGFSCRRSDILKMRQVIKTHAVGYIEGHKLHCRPKKDSTAVMFLIDGNYSWCHLKNDEYKIIFGN
jgi:hypothetical protein